MEMSREHRADQRAGPDVVNRLQCHRVGSLLLHAIGRVAAGQFLRNTHQIRAGRVAVRQRLVEFGRVDRVVQEQQNRNAVRRLLLQSLQLPFFKEIVAVVHADQLHPAHLAGVKADVVRKIRLHRCKASVAVFRILLFAVPDVDCEFVITRRDQRHVVFIKEPLCAIQIRL